MREGEKMKPLISVVVPVYNCEAYLEKCVLSIINQTYPNIEIILVNDGSTDNSWEKCEKLKKEFSNIYIYKQENKGQASARNYGARKAKGKYIGFVDSDDFINERMYEVLYNLIDEYNAQIACCGIDKIRKGKHVAFFNDRQDDLILYNKLEALREIINNSIITSSPCDKLYESSIVKNNPMIEGMIFEDFEVIPRWISKCDRIIYTGKALYYYRLMEQSTMSTYNEKRFDEVKASYLRIKFYEKVAPELVKIVKTRDIEIRLNVLSYTRGANECKKRRRQLARKTKKSIQKMGILNLSRSYYIKAIMLMIGLPVFDFTNHIYSWVRKRVCF